MSCRWTIAWATDECRWKTGASFPPTSGCRSGPLAKSPCDSSTCRNAKRRPLLNALETRLTAQLPHLYHCPITVRFLLSNLQSLTQPSGQDTLRPPTNNLTEWVISQDKPSNSKQALPRLPSEGLTLACVCAHDTVLFGAKPATLLTLAHDLLAIVGEAVWSYNMSTIYHHDLLLQLDWIWR